MVFHGSMRDGSWIPPPPLPVSQLCEEHVCENNFFLNRRLNQVNEIKAKNLLIRTFVSSR